MGWLDKIRSSLSISQYPIDWLLSAEYVLQWWVADWVGDLGSHFQLYLPPGHFGSSLYESIRVQYLEKDWYMYPHLFHCGLTPTNPTILIIHLFVGFRGLLCIQEVSFLTASSFSVTATSTCSSSSHLNFSAFPFSILSVVIHSYSHFVCSSSTHFFTASLSNSHWSIRCFLMSATAWAYISPSG